MVEAEPRDALESAVQRGFLVTFPAAFDRRAAAALIDAGAYATLWFCSLVLSGVVAGAMGLGRLLSLNSPVLGSICSTSLLLYSLTDVLWTATPGMLLLRLRVARRDGRPASPYLRMRRWAIRNCPLWLVTGACVFTMLAEAAPWGRGPLTALARDGGDICALAALASGVVLLLGSLLALSNARRTLHDYLSGTSVYRAADVAALAAEADRGFPPVIATASRFWLSPSSPRERSLPRGSSPDVAGNYPR